MSVGKTRLGDAALPELSLTSTGNISSNESQSSGRKQNSASSTQPKKQEDYSLKEYRPSPFKLRRVHGYNRMVPIINLCRKHRAQVFYAASNCGVLYDWRDDKMKLLQGHRNAVTCISSDADGQWLLTADSGPDNVITIWDSKDRVPTRTIFHPHGNTKLANAVLSANAKYLLTMAYKEKVNLNWWIWSFGQDSPHATIDIDEPRDSIIQMSFNPVESEQFFLLTRRNLWIGACASVIASDYQKYDMRYELKVRTPPIKSTIDYGRLTSYTYVPASGQVLVGNTRGAVVIFGYAINFVKNADAGNIENLRFVKMLKLENAKINVIETIDDVIVTGNDLGELKFYDLQLKLLYWCQGFKVNSIKRISFDINQRHFSLVDPASLPEGCQNCPCTEHNILTYDNGEEMFQQQFVASKVPTDATKLMNAFMIRDFMICTEGEGIGMVDLVNGKHTPILSHRSSHATSMSVHPDKSFLCLAYEDGQVELLDYTCHKSVMKLDIREHFKVVEPSKPDSMKSFKHICIPTICCSCLKYSPSGFHLACGLDNGELLFLHPTTIDIKNNKKLMDSSAAIQQICYSPDSMTLAFADAERKTCVYTYDCDTRQWQFLAKHKAHYKPITSILFSDVKNDDGFYKLLSFGEDRVMVEYDLGSSTDQYLEITSLDRVEQSAVPRAVMLWRNPEGGDIDVPAVLVANDQYKYKVINHSTAMTLGTFLGPRYETPVQKMQLIKKNNEGPQYLLFATKNVIGIQKLPLDGNPYKHAALLGHPNEITEMCFRDDSGSLFTIGKLDSCMSQWAVKYRAVETSSKIGGDELDPYYCLLEHGRAGWLFQEMRDLFYYVQILCQGTFSPAFRRVGDMIPVDSLPDLMRALGFFPSEYELENLLTEAKYKVYNKEPASDIGFEDYVKLYLNHRPAFGESLDKLKEAFCTFSTYEKNGEPAISGSDFPEVLNTYGEYFSRELTSYLLKILMGLHADEENSNVQPSNQQFAFLPEDMTFKDFATDILGMSLIEDTVEQLSTAPESLHVDSSTLSQE